MQTTKSSGSMARVATSSAWFSAPDFRWVLFTDSITITPSYRAATSWVPSSQLSHITMIESGRRRCPSTDSMVRPMYAASLWHGMITVIQCRTGRAAARAGSTSVVASRDMTASVPVCA